VPTCGTGHVCFLCRTIGGEPDALQLLRAAPGPNPQPRKSRNDLVVSTNADAYVLRPDAARPGSRAATFPGAAHPL